MGTDTVLISHLLTQNVDSENTTHNHLLLITQAQKVDVLRVEVSDKDACSWNSKPSSSSSLIPYTYYHFFHTLLIPFSILYTILSL